MATRYAPAKELPANAPDTRSRQAPAAGDTPPAASSQSARFAPPAPSSTRAAHLSRPSPRRARPLGPLPAGALGLALLIAWQALTQSGAVNPYFLPAPADVARAFWASLTTGGLLGYAGMTLLESAAGFALGSLVALPTGYLVARNRLIASAIEPYLAASQALPAVALAPLLVLWLNYGLPPVAALCALIVFFPSVVNTVLGIRSLDRDVVDAARVDGANRWALLWHVEGPLALPSVLAGLRTSLTLSVTGAVVGEFVAGSEGLGYLLNYDRSNYDTPGVFATMLALTLLATALYLLARLAERTLSYQEA